MTTPLVTSRVHLEAVIPITEAEEEVVVAVVADTEVVGVVREETGVMRETGGHMRISKNQTQV